MGAWFSIVYPWWQSPEIKCLMLGLDNAGKTTILFKLKLGEVITTIPTIGFNVETLTYKRLTLCIWDLGGQSKLRPFYVHYFEGVKALIYVIDSNDRDRIQEAREELRRILEDACFCQTAALLVYANKQDLPDAMSISEITKGLDLHMHQERPWHVQGICALSGEGLCEGLNWLVDKLSKR